MFRWGYPFLEHAYLYHIGRTDHRHNFSPYFYPLYLGLPIGNSGILGELEVHGRSRLLGLLAFIPQILLSIGGGLWLAVALSSPADPTTATTRPTPSNSLAASRSSKQSMNTTASQHLPFIFLVQTLIFVALNKVCTSQYFMWYLWFLPLVISHFIPTGDTGLSPSNTKVEGACEGNGLTASKTMWMVGLWVGSQALWLSQGYRLEFLGEMVFVPLWAAGIVMLGVNSWLVACLLKGYRVE